MRLQTGALAVVPLWMVLNKNIPAGALRLWLYLHAVYTNKRTELSRAEMADLMDVTVETIDRWIHALRDEGCLKVIHNRTEKNGWMPNEYELIMVQGSHIDVATYHDKIPLPEPTTSTEKTARSRMRQAGVLYKELSTNKDQVVQKTTHPRFKEWWRQYPRKAKKQAALKVWDKLDVETDDELWESISEGTKRYNQYWRANQTAQRYIPHPTTWLRQQQWEDELPTPTPKVSKQTQSLVSASEGFLSRHKEESS